MHFAGLCDALELQRGAITIATFSTAIALSAGVGWASMIVADTPNDTALLDAIKRHFEMTHCAS
jgi:hypothetical protein